VGSCTFRGMWSPSGVDIDRELSALMPALSNLTWGKSFLPWDAHLMAESSWYLGMYFWPSCYVGRWWDGFRTWVHTVRCTWAPAAMSLCARHLRPSLPEAQSGQRLSVCGRPPGMLDQGLGSLRQVDERGRRVRRVVKSRSPMLIVGWRSDSHGSFPTLILFRLVAPPLQPGVVEQFPSTGCMVS
jgi:hypothetical protein